MFNICNPYILGNRDEPPTLYSLMQSMVNYNNDNPVKNEELSNAAKSIIFDFDYPLDAVLKPSFETMFLDHYMFRRIGFETYTAWKIHLKVKLNDIMSKYNILLSNISNLTLNGKKVHETESIIDNNTANNSINSMSSGSSTTDNRYSDTPENEISSVQDGTYVSDYTYNQQTENNSNTTVGNSSSNNNKSRVKDFSEVDNVDEYLKVQEKLGNIYSRIFKECDSLFYAII